MHSIYQPAEDSYLLQNSLKKILKDKSKNIKILDMGSGSGIQALTCKELGFENITAVDINPKAIDYIRKKDSSIKTIKSNLFSSLKDKSKFDLIIFNPPYLPEDPREPKESRVQTTAGKKGYEIIVNFLEQAKSFLKNNAEILLLFSSLSKPTIIKTSARKLGYKYKLLEQQNLAFFEKLFVFRFKQQ